MTSNSEYQRAYYWRNVEKVRAQKRVSMKRLRTMHHEQYLKYGKQWYEKHKDQINTARKERRKTDATFRMQERERKLVRKFSITWQQYEDMFKRQGGKCAICQRPERTINRRGEIFLLAVDHDHETNEIRGLLCNNCNRGIGLLETQQNLLSALAYLQTKE